MARELELKLELNPGDLEAFRNHPLLGGAPGNTQPQISVYFDTKKNKVRKAGYTLRVRRTKGGFVQTVKQVAPGAGLFDRGEWEAEVAELRPDAAAVAGTPLEPLLTPETVRKLVPLVRSHMDRTVWLIAHGASQLEVILDEGTIQGGANEQNVVEVEIELKSGSVASVVDFARRLGGSVGVRIGVLTKAERGFALVDGSLDGPVKAGRTHVDPASAVADAFTAIVYSCLRHFRLNEGRVVAHRDPGSLHQARVAMRRLRSALSLFRPAVADARFASLREELKWFTSNLGDARNLDVFLGRLEAEHPERARLEAGREQAYANVLDALASQRFRDLVLDLVAWTETGEWRQTKKATKKLRSFSKRRIDRLWDRIEEAGAQLLALDEEPRHRLRIQIKKLRYALEFFADLHGAKPGRQRRFMAAVESLQEDLGYLNDMATALDMIADHLRPPTAPAVIDQPVEGEESTHLANAQASYEKLRSVGPFWR